MNDRERGESGAPGAPGARGEGDAGGPGGIGGEGGRGGLGPRGGHGGSGGTGGTGADAVAHARRPAWRRAVVGVFVGVTVGAVGAVGILVPVSRNRAICESVNRNRDTLREVLEIIRDADATVTPLERELGRKILPKLEHEQC